MALQLKTFLNRLSLLCQTHHFNFWGKPFKSSTCQDTPQGISLTSYQTHLKGLCFFAETHSFQGDVDVFLKERPHKCWRL
jgi:hypothetical protein